MDQDRIEKEMHELEGKIKYQFKNINLLSKAMGSIKTSKSKNDYMNGALATIGDSIIKFVLADKFYKENDSITKSEITDKKSKLESNSTLSNLVKVKGWIHYAYNKDHFHDDPNIPDNEKVLDNEHDPYVEAIVAAIYYDSNFETVKKWIIDILLPLLEEYSK